MDCPSNCLPVYPFVWFKYYNHLQERLQSVSYSHTHCTSEDKDASCLAGFPSLVRMWTTVTLQSGGAAGMCADYRDCARNNTARGKGKKLDAPVLFIKMSVADLFTVIKISALGLQLLHHVPEYLQTWSTSDFRKKSVWCGYSLKCQISKIPFQVSLKKKKKQITSVVAAVPNSQIPLLIRECWAMKFWLLCMQTQLWAPTWVAMKGRRCETRGAVF